MMMSLLFINVPAYAAIEEIDASGQYTIGDGPDENISVAKERAKVDAMRQATEKAGVYVESYSKTVNAVLTEDEVRVIAGNVLKVKSEDIKPVINSNNTITYVCDIKALVDTSKIDFSTQLQNKTLLNENAKLQKEIYRLNTEIENLKNQYSKADIYQKDSLNKELQKNEQQFSIAQLELESYKLDHNGKYQEAIEVCNKIIAVTPSVSAYNNRGLAYSNLGFIDNAIKDYKKAIEIDATASQAYYNLAFEYEKKSMYNDALKLLEKANSLEPNNAQYLEEIGKCYDDMRNYEKSLEYHNKAIILNPSNAIAYNNRGATLSKMNRQDDAIKDYKKAIELDDTYASSYYNLAVEYNKKAMYNDALRLLEKATSLNPDNATFNEALGLIYDMLGDTDSALKYFDKSISLHSDSETIYASRAYALQENNKNTEALIDINKAINTAKEKGSHLHEVSNLQTRALIYIKLKEFKNAICDVNEAISLDPKSVFSYVFRGMSYAFSGDENRGIENENMALDISPNFYYANMAKVEIYLYYKHYDKALAECNTLLNKYPKISEFYRLRAIVYRFMNQYDKALDDCNIAIRINENNRNKKDAYLPAYTSSEARAYTSRSLVYYRMKNYQEALNDASTAKILQPNNVDIAKFYEKIKNKTYVDTVDNFLFHD